MSIYDIAGFIALFLFLLSYAMVNLGIWRESQMRFHLPNFVGAALMLFSLTGNWNLPVFILEICWGSIAFYGMVKAKKSQGA